MASGNLRVSGMRLGKKKLAPNQIICNHQGELWYKSKVNLTTQCVRLHSDAWENVQKCRVLPLDFVVQGALPWAYYMPHITDIRLWSMIFMLILMSTMSVVGRLPSWILLCHRGYVWICDDTFVLSFYRSTNKFRDLKNSFFLNADKERKKRKTQIKTLKHNCYYFLNFIKFHVYKYLQI